MMLKQLNNISNVLLYATHHHQHHYNGGWAHVCHTPIRADDSVSAPRCSSLEEVDCSHTAVQFLRLCGPAGF